MPPWSSMLIFCLLTTPTSKDLSFHCRDPSYTPPKDRNPPITWFKRSQVMIIRFCPWQRGIRPRRRLEELLSECEGLQGIQIARKTYQCGTISVMIHIRQMAWEFELGGGGCSTDYVLRYDGARGEEKGAWCVVAFTG
ncbi:uncharacterized protein BDZ99DRAFT_310451 [Mytilinidion resinicola]|uniref:Ig-like domain-containing protein n=1 Tax=Mytilinidion resinicola TaxID=574789 RepID=A0A6A6YR00_9PEZI|nr:uncharacterized protein BDZ99DRAFT_310451 [Mytilinidion resinicola]KAF2810385.1 hypothetical protein BDZ99DRAFT_310451 [Mytilinidion resinicola]